VEEKTVVLVDHDFLDLVQRIEDLLFFSTPSVPRDEDIIIELLFEVIENGVHTLESEAAFHPANIR